MRNLLAAACVLAASSLPSVAQDRTVVILLDPASGSISDVVAAPVSESSAELLDLLLARLIDAEKRAEDALAAADPDGLRRELDNALEREQQDMRRMELLNMQVSALRGQVERLQEFVGEMREREADLVAEIEELKNELISAR